MASPIPYRVTAGNKATQIIGSAATIYSYHITNLNNTAVYVKFYNKTAATVDPSSDTPATVLTVPAASGPDNPGILDNAAVSIAFATAVSVRCATINQNKSTSGPAIELDIQVDLAQASSGTAIDAIVDSGSGFELTFDTSLLTADRQAVVPDGPCIFPIPNTAAARSFVTGISAAGVLSTASPVVLYTAGNSSSTIATGSTFVLNTATLTAARTYTLPPISNYANGEQVIVMDGSGTCSSTVPILVAPDTTDTIGGVNAAVTMTLPYGVMILTRISNTGWKLQHSPGDSGSVDIARNVASVSMIATVGTTTDIFKVPANKSFLLTSASAVITAVTGFSSVATPAFKIETSAGGVMGQLAPASSWDTVGEVTASHQDNISGKVATAGQTVRTNITTQNGSTSLTATVFVTGILY